MKYLKCHWCGRKTAVPNYDSKKLSTILCSCSEEGIKQIDIDIFANRTSYKDDEVTSAVHGDGRFFINNLTL